MKEKKYNIHPYNCECYHYIEIKWWLIQYLGRKWLQYSISKYYRITSWRDVFALFLLKFSPNLIFYKMIFEQMLTKQCNYIHIIRYNEKYISNYHITFYLGNAYVSGHSALQYVIFWGGFNISKYYLTCTTYKPLQSSKHCTFKWKKFMARAAGLKVRCSTTEQKSPFSDAVLEVRYKSISCA